MPWNLIIKYVFDDKYIYLYISEDRCVIIPFYKLEEQKKDIIEFIKNKKPA
jgi:hypothetical protein